MTRTRVAAVLGVVALLSVLATAAVAVTRNDGDEPEVVLTVARGGSTFEVPADGWTVADPSVRIFYTDESDRPAAVVHGPAIYRVGYCGKDSNQAFAGFTRQPLAAWVGALGVARDVEREQVEVDGADATLQRVTVDVDATGPCGTPTVDVSMIEADGVRVVVVSDAGALPAVETILTSLQLR